MKTLFMKIAAAIGDAIERWIRTIVPVAIAYFAAKFPFIVDQFHVAPETLTVFVLTAYYTFFAFLETKVHPAFGWFLGRPKTPAPV